MKAKAYILIVEDESATYLNWKQDLVKHSYEVGPFTNSVHKAREVINLRRPDLVLLDINLHGEHDGFVLGKMLDEKYHIPFLYVTERDDDQSFYEGLNTNHHDYLIKAKPTYNVEDFIRTIQTVLHRTKKKPLIIEKEGIMVFTKEGYLDYGAGENPKIYEGKIYKEVIRLVDIIMFDKEQKEGIPKLRKHSIRVEHFSGTNYYLRASLNDIQKVMPQNFVRISKDKVVNISPNYFDGRINGKQIIINLKRLNITNTYRPEFERRMRLLYHPADLTRG